MRYWLNTYLSEIRLLLAYSVSPLIAPICLYFASLVAYGFDSYNASTVLSTTYQSIGYSYILIILLGTPCYFLIKRYAAVSIRNLAVTGAGLGLVSAVVINTMSGTFMFVLYLLLLCIGSLIGAGFWMIAFYSPNNKKQLKSRRSRRKR